jgi:hypothetical protein
MGGNGKEVCVRLWLVGQWPLFFFIHLSFFTGSVSVDFVSQFSVQLYFKNRIIYSIFNVYEKLS